MLRSKGLYLLAVAVMASLAFVGQAVSQESRPANSGPGNGRGFGRGNFDPAQARQQMEQFMKDRLGASDDEWKVLQPKLEKVQNAQRDMRGGFGRGFGRGRGGQPGGQPDANAAPQSEVEKARDALSKVLENKDAKPDEIKTALQGLRDARAKAKTNLEAAQKELKDVLTVKQEAQLVEMGMLE